MFQNPHVITLSGVGEFQSGAKYSHFSTDKGRNPLGELVGN